MYVEKKILREIMCCFERNFEKMPGERRVVPGPRVRPPSSVRRVLQGAHLLARRFVAKVHELLRGVPRNMGPGEAIAE